MTLEQAFFVQALAAYIQGKPDIRVPGGWESLDWPQLLQYARTQNLAGIFYVQCRDNLSRIPALQSILEELHAGFVSEAAHSVARQQDLAQLEQQLTQAEIPFLPFKGSVLSQCYPAPQLRTMGDTDFLIRGKDRLHCHQLMCSLHYTPKEDPGAVWTYSDGVVTYEIHSHMFYEPLANQVDYQSYFDQAWRFARPLLDTSRYELDEGFHFLYLMAHTAKHIINKGCGLRPFLDMVFFIQQQNRNMNWVWITQQLEELDLLAFTQTCDGMFFRNKDVAVLGGGNGAAASARSLARLCRQVHVIFRKEHMSAEAREQEALAACPNVILHPGTLLAGLSGGEQLEALALEDRATGRWQELPCQGLFAAIGRIPETVLLQGQVKLDSQGYVLAGESTQTNLPGVYAAGDIRTKPLRQIVTAAADGATAAHLAARYLGDSASPET